ncbi:MAG: hypothetical protein RBS57_16220 [Desulforhabdus sp.]|jgi:hypothetical protein|nr:hypothetical protein [Desulforhabdus sp.]
MERTRKGLRFILIPLILTGFLFGLSARLEGQESTEREPFGNVPAASKKIVPDIDGKLIGKAPADPFGKVEDVPLQTPPQVQQEPKFRLFPEGLSSALSGRPREEISESPVADPVKLNRSAFGKVPTSQNTSPFGNVPGGVKSNPFGNVLENNP